MASLDNAAAADRVIPCANQAFAPVKFTFTSSASALQTFRTKVANQNLPPLYISFKVTADCHIIFGDASTAAPDNTYPLFQAADGWQDFMIPAEVCCFRVKGDSGGGDIYIFASGH